MSQTAEITISLEDYNSLIENSLFLNLLENNGVDNWEGYEACYEEFLKQTKKHD